MVGEINKIMVCKPVKHWTWWKWESLWPFFKKKKKCFWEFVVGQIWEAKSLENWEWLWDNIPRWCSGKKSTCYCRRHKRHRFNSWVGKIPWRRKWQPVFLLGEFHGQRSLADDGPWGCKGSDTTFKAEVRSLQWELRDNWGLAPPMVQRMTQCKCDSQGAQAHLGTQKNCITHIGGH